MRTTVDIPDPVYRRLKAKAAQQGCSVKELVLRGLRAQLENRKRVGKGKRVALPIIGSRRAGWLQLTNSQINEILFP